MFISTFFNSFSVLLPVLFVMGLGFCAGYARQFDRDQVQGLNELVLEFALPASLFVVIVTTSRSSLLATFPFLIALLIGFLGLFVVVTVFIVFVLHQVLGVSAMHAY